MDKNIRVSTYNDWKHIRNKLMNNDSGEAYTIRIPKEGRLGVFRYIFEAGDGVVKVCVREEKSGLAVADDVLSKSLINSVTWGELVEYLFNLL